MPELHDRLIARIAALLAPLPPRRRLLVGVSGGLDSMLLLDLVQAAAGDHLPVLAVHVDHGLSPRAGDWAAHVVQACAARGIACVACRVSVDRDRPSREAAARDARHAAFARHLQPGDALLLGHHADDQAETLLLRLLRGSGIDGLGAMRAVRPFAGIDDAWLLRPLLEVPRAELATLARARSLHWVEDESNADTAIDRNYLRHEVVPALATRWPAAVVTLARTAGRMAESDTLLNRYLDADLVPLLDGQAPAIPTLDVAGLHGHPPPLQVALLRRWLQRCGAPPFQQAWLAQLCALAAARADAEGLLCVAGWEVHRFRGRLHAFPRLPAADAADVLAWDMRGDLDLGAGRGVLRARPVTAGSPASAGLLLAGIAPGTAVSVCFRQGGERLRPAGGSGSRPLKKVLQDLGVPPWQRARIPLLRAGAAALCVGDLLVDAAFAPAPGRPATLSLDWQVE